MKAFNRGLAALAMALAFAGAAVAQEAPPLSRENIESWAQETLGGAVERGEITGAVVSIVHRGEVVFEGGYGLGDVVSGAPAGANTRVRIGSTTKTFTATLLAQLLEEGAIQSLDDPANQYLRRYQLPANQGEPIRLRHLLTHTAGFADRFFFIGADEPVDIPVRAEVFDLQRPGFARPVDEQVVYSNFGVATLGLVVEDLSGGSINHVMRDRIFAPLGMTNTELVVTIEEPRDLARPGLISAEGMIGPTPYTAINPAVAQTGSIVTSAHDMTAYMNAQLGHTDVVSDGMRTRLRTRLAANAAEGAGIAMVFIEDQWAGRRTISHGGNWAGFHSWMTLSPEDDLGVFVTLLSEATPVGMAGRLQSALNPSWGPAPSPAILSAGGINASFMARFFGAKREIARADETESANLEHYAGFYRADRRPYSTSERLSSLIYFGADVVEVSAGAGGLYVGGAGPWIPQGEGRFVLDTPTRPLIVIRPNPRTGALVLAPDVGVYTSSRIAAWAHPKFAAIIVHLLTPLTLVGFAAPLLIGLGWRTLAPIGVAIGGATMIGAALVGLGDGDTLMTGYYAGHLERIGVFVLGGDLVLVSSLATFLIALFSMRGVRGRKSAFTVAAIGLVLTTVLACYGGVGVVVN